MHFLEMMWETRRYIKKWVIRELLFTFALLWMLVIFGFSAADAEESSSFSDVITEKVVTIVETDYDNLSESEQQLIWHDTSYVIRKIGHFGEYAILGILIGLLFITFETIRKDIKLIFLSEIIGFIYACTDEFHQGFVDGRAPGAIDVVIDSAGYLSAIMFISLVIIIRDYILNLNQRVK